MKFRLFQVFGCWAALAVTLGTLDARAGQLSSLAPPPDWTGLNGYQKTITRDQFAHWIDSVYSPDGGFWRYVTIDDSQAVIYSDLAKKQPLFTLHFAASEAACAPLPYTYKTQAVSTDPARPLKGIRIALDPGHIGGDWAQLEARYFKLGDDPSVEEAKLNMITCDRLAERLEADGADIVWAKHSYEPTTNLRPDSLHREAIEALALHSTYRPGSGGETSMLFGLPIFGGKSHSDNSTSTRVDNEAALLFYRVAEIRARAELVNKLHPDLTICVHYNADDWGDPDNPTLTSHSRLIIFVNGSYEKSELVNDDVKYDMLRKVLDRDAPAEEKGCALVGQQMLDTLKYPAESYTTYSTRHVTSVPSVYARNLLANRLYHGPVIYCEGPYMNAKDAYYRIIAGDYLGQKVINGQSYTSVYREYAAAVEHGVLQYFGVK